eukprot:CAMPEP_0114500326 /NCGR_PEP_ID=MMETSP0109-20121206/7902_1 /TAXON_ID=29199 /ORGANISM="Chlorarachnion reptans, Strain CCCM449" /LENGTH=138 /DNA_ID=CAMNT_0001677975 /DNA_START=177 /DNA_END=593 /DNA_ORIENTATION=-
MTKTAVQTNLLHALEVLAHLGGKIIGNNLEHLVCLAVTLPVEEPIRDVELVRLGENGNNRINLLCCELTSPLIAIYPSPLAAESGKTTSHTTNVGKSERNFSASINVGVEDTKNVGKIFFFNNKRHLEIQEAKGELWL